MSFDETKYKNTMNYPKESNFYRYTVLSDEGEKLGSFENQQSLVEEYGEDLLKVCNTVNQKVRTEGKASVVYGDLVVVIKYDKDAFLDYRKAYGEENGRLYELFYRDCCEDHGCDPDSALSSVIFSEAYDRGHSAGYSEVYSYFDSIASFADRVLEAAK